MVYYYLKDGLCDWSVPIPIRSSCMNTRKVYHINLGFLIIILTVILSLLLTVFALDELFINLTEHNVIRPNPLERHELTESREPSLEISALKSFFVITR